MAQDEIVDRSPESLDELGSGDSHCAQLGPIPTARAQLERLPQALMKTAEPDRLLQRVEVGVLAQGPGEDARSRPGRANDEYRSNGRGAVGAQLEQPQIFRAHDFLGRPHEVLMESFVMLEPPEGG